MSFCPTPQLIAGSISRCRRSVDCGTTRLNGYAKQLPLGLSLEKYLRSLNVYTTQQCHVSCFYSIVQTKQTRSFTQHSFALDWSFLSTDAPFLSRSLFFSYNLMASWLFLTPTVPVVPSKAPRWQSVMRPKLFIQSRPVRQKEKREG